MAHNRWALRRFLSAARGRSEDEEVPCASPFIHLCIMSYHVMSCHVMSCHVMHIVSYRVASSYLLFSSSFNSDYILLNNFTSDDHVFFLYYFRIIIIDCIHAELLLVAGQPGDRSPSNEAPGGWEENGWCLKDVIKIILIICISCHSSPIDHRSWTTTLPHHTHNHHDHHHEHHHHSQKHHHDHHELALSVLNADTTDRWPGRSLTRGQCNC